MTAAHFAAALAIKGRVPRASTGWLIVGAFVPDFCWIAFATLGIEPTKREIFFDDWSHSLLMVLLYAVGFALCFRQQGRPVVWAMAAAVVSHFLLDLPVHPKDLALFPHSTIHLGLGLTPLPPMTYWLIQLGAVAVLLGAYIYATGKLRIEPQGIFASCVLVLGWHIAMMPR